MVFSSQFALSLELTRLIPLDLAPSKAAGAVMRLARELQNAGSDIVIEEDMAEVFGRCRISRTLESSFRTCVATPGTRRDLFERIVLDDSPGPTVSRSLANDHPAYLATVIQLSLLSSVHDRQSLAAHTALALEERNIGSPPDKVRPVPSQEGIAGVIRAIEDHTSRYNWTGLIEAVATTLDISVEDASEPLAPAIFRGATTMFPMVQTLPVDREIFVQTNSGVCVLVVWAHHVLGLNVLVKRNSEVMFEAGEFEETYFGNEKAQIVIEYGSASYLDNLDSITLLEAATKEVLFTLKADFEDEETLEPIITWPVKEYGRRTLLKHWKIFKAAAEEEDTMSDSQDAIVNDMMHIACALGLNMKERLRRRDEDSVRDCTKLGTLDVSNDRVLEAGALLFQGSRMDQKKILQYTKLYADQTLESMVAPQSTKAAASQLGLMVTQWRADLLLPAQQLSVLILALANVVDLPSAQNFLLNSDLELILRQEDLVLSLPTWDGQTILHVRDGVWYEVLALLMIGHREKSPLRNAFINSTALISEKGWTICNNAIGLLNPSRLDPGAIMARRGVPCRDGVRKHAIISGNTATVPDIRKRLYMRHAGELVPLNSGIPTEWARSFCADQGDSFIVSLRITQEQMKHSTIRRCGHRELSKALWAAERTSPCKHGRTKAVDQKNVADEMELPVDSVAVAIHGDKDIKLLSEKVVVCLTGASAAARWRSLIAINSLHENDIHDDYSSVSGKNSFSILLRKEDCCNICAVQQAFLYPSQCYVVL